MRALLDVNVLIALLDADHIQHRAAQSWLRANSEDGWASCPLTQNGCVRIMSQPAYPGALPVGAVMTRLGVAARTDQHEFWPDDVSLLDTSIVDATRLHGARQITDVYLLALAVAHSGRFVTFDRRIALSAVHGARDEHLVTI